MSRRPRSEDDDIPVPTPTIGSAEAVLNDASNAAAVLWVPDPEQRRGWREFYIDKPGAAPRPFGFRKPGAK